MPQQEWAALAPYADTGAERRLRTQPEHMHLHTAGIMGSVDTQHTTISCPAQEPTCFRILHHPPHTNMRATSTMHVC